MPQKLNRKNASISIERPVKVLQFGNGNFLRGFADWMIEILNEKTDFNGSVRIVAPLRKGRDVPTDDQDGLFHVVINGYSNGKVVADNKLITSVRETIDPYEDHERFVRSARDPDTKLVISNSTESGIAFDINDNTVTEPATSFPGKVTQWLWERFQHFEGDEKGGVYFLPCELIQNNGDQLREIILQYVLFWKLPLQFTSWVNDHITFCNTLVDRIVTGFPKDRVDSLRNATGFDDVRMVAAEPYYLWVIESKNNIENYFPATTAGLSVLFVNDIEPYRTRKVRILNGAHTAMMAYAYLHGLRTVREAIEDPAIFAFVDHAVRKEIIPTLPLPAAELSTFTDEVLERFKNPYIKHELASIALNSISKFKVRVLPSMLEYQMIKGVLPKNLVHAMAALFLFYKGEWKGDKTPIKDDAQVIEFFNDAWSKPELISTVDTILSNTALWGEDLTRINGFSRSLTQSMELLMRN